MTGTGDEPPAEHPWPDEIGAALDGDPGPVTEIGPGLWRTVTGTVRRFHGDDPIDEVDLLRRLGSAAPFPVPQVLAVCGRWAALRLPPGRPAHRPENHGDPDDLVVAIGSGLRSLHELPLTVVRGDVATAGGCVARSPAEGWEAVAARCRLMVESGAVERDRLPAPYDRYGPARLLSMLIDGRPETEEPVCCHGFPVAERILVDGGRFAGFERYDTTLVADRHLDLAVAHLSVQHHLGPEAVFRFYDSYGADPDLVRLDHYVLAAHLLGAVTGGWRDGGHDG